MISISRLRTAAVIVALASLCATDLTAQTVAKRTRPTLVVGIVVDGMQQRYIDLLMPYFGQGGFRRLLQNGVVMEHVDYGTPVDPTAAAAMLYTGAPAAVSGIPSALVYDRVRNMPYSVFLDPEKIGNFTDETYSPKALQVSTLGDEIRIDNGGLGNVHAIAPDASMSIIMAGHAGNSAFWLSDVDGRWATTTHYKDVPAVVTKRNFTNPLSARLDTLMWSPRMALEDYPDLPDYKKYFAFKHTFSRGNKDRYRWYKRSAPVNTEVTDMALDYIDDLRMGKRGVMDMLNLGYTVQPYPGARDSDARLEAMDAYLRLDRELERLFKALDGAVGADNLMVFMAGTPELSTDQADDPRWNIPYGEFSPKKAMTLLRMYLIALHGNGEWVQGYHDRQFFLNEDLVKEKNLDMRTIRAESAAFLERMSGVSQAWTIDDAQSGRIGVRPDMLRRNTSVKLAGDVFISVNPGWEIYDDTQSGRATRRLYRAVPSTAPVYIMMPGFEASRIETPVDVLSVAPTIARFLRIRLPNAAENPTISTIFAPLLKK